MNARARAALLCALVACAASAALPQYAVASYPSYYDCDNKPVALWCDGRANGSFDGLHSWDFNQGWRDGPWDHTVIICEHVWRPSTGYELPGGTCQYNGTSHYYGNITCACYEAEVRQYSSGPQNINGFADADY